MMKGNTLLILLAIATLSLTACGKEPVEVPTETAVEETTPAETASTETKNPEDEIEAKIKEAVAEWDILLENGEITQEDYDREVESITQLIKAMYSVSPDELDLSEDYLPDELKGLDEKTEEEIEEIFQEMEKENYEQFAQEENQKANQDAEQPQGSQSNQETNTNETQEIPEWAQNQSWEDLFGDQAAEDDARIEQAIENAPNITWTDEEYNEFINSN